MYRIFYNLLESQIFYGHLLDEPMKGWNSGMLEYWA